MKLVNADSLMGKFETELYNPEEFPVMMLGDVKRMIDKEQEAFDLKKLISDMDEMIKEYEHIKEKAEDTGNLEAAMISDLICTKVRALKESARDALLIPDNEHLFQDA